jgi:hypothetical protein
LSDRALELVRRDQLAKHEPVADCSQPADQWIEIMGGPDDSIWRYRRVHHPPTVPAGKTLGPVDPVARRSPQVSVRRAFAPWTSALSPHQ